MKILLITNYFYPETVGASVWIRQLVDELLARGHSLSVITSFPSYPHGVIFDGYRGLKHLRETSDGVDLIRTFTYAARSRTFWSKALGFAAFSVSALIGGLVEMPRADVVYAILPPLPLGVSAALLAKAIGAGLVLNVQDIYPDVAIANGLLTSRWSISIFKWLEKVIYERADKITVISSGFRTNLIEKGVDEAKVRVIPNWADTAAICSREKKNEFRNELGVSDEVLVVYSGGLTTNSCLEPVLEAARQVADEGIVFAIIGDGVRKEALLRKAKELELRNVRFLPFQPLQRYPEVLAAADVTLVTLNSASTFASVPSKVYKQMAAARPIIAIAERASELNRLIETSMAGFCVCPERPSELAEILRRIAGDKSRFSALGLNGRRYLERECSLTGCVAAIEAVLAETVRGA